MKILILNGPNLNLLGKREPTVYGKKSLTDLEQTIHAKFPEHTFKFEQTNCEGTLIDLIQKAGDDYEGMVLNAGGYSHTSIAIRDAVAAIGIPVIEVHISNIFARESFRANSIIAPVCSGSVAGFGLRSYEIAVYGLVEM